MANKESVNFPSLSAGPIGWAPGQDTNWPETMGLSSKAAKTSDPEIRVWSIGNVMLKLAALPKTWSIPQSNQFMIDMLMNFHIYISKSWNLGVNLPTPAMLGKSLCLHVFLQYPGLSLNPLFPSQPRSFSLNILAPNANTSEPKL